MQRSRTHEPLRAPRLVPLEREETSVIAAGSDSNQSAVEAVGNKGRTLLRPRPDSMWTEGLSTEDRPQEKKKKKRGRGRKRRSRREEGGEEEERKRRRKEGGKEEETDQQQQKQEKQREKHREEEEEEEKKKNVRQEEFLSNVVITMKALLTAPTIAVWF